MYIIKIIEVSMGCISYTKHVITNMCYKHIKENINTSDLG